MQIDVSHGYNDGEESRIKFIGGELIRERCAIFKAQQIRITYVTRVQTSTICGPVSSGRVTRCRPQP